MGERSRCAAQKVVALVLSGGVTRGAFEAGVLSVLGQRSIRVCRIVGTSSGALNGTALAAAVRGRREREAVDRIRQTWERRGGLFSVLSPNLGAILGCRGFSDQDKLLALLRDLAPPRRMPDPAPVELRIIVAVVHGVQSHIHDEPATTHMKVLRFQDEDFDSPERIERVYRAATASAAFPMLFAPVDLPGVGPCMDGGIVNNTPVQNAFGPLDGEPLDAILVVAPTPALLETHHRPYRGFELFAHTVDMIFSEWLFKELRQSVLREERLAAVEYIEGLSPAQLEAVKAALGKAGRCPVPIVTIRPVTSLPGNLFSGFTDPSMRQRYIAIGMERARQVLDRLGWC